MAHILLKNQDNKTQCVSTETEQQSSIDLTWPLFERKEEGQRKDCHRELVSNGNPNNLATTGKCRKPKRTCIDASSHSLRASFSGTLPRRMSWSNQRLEFDQCRSYASTQLHAADVGLGLGGRVKCSAVCERNVSTEMT